MMGTVHRILDDVVLMLSFLRFTGTTGSAGPALCGGREYKFTKQMFIIVRARWRPTSYMDAAFVLLACKGSETWTSRLLHFTQVGLL